MPEPDLHFMVMIGASLLIFLTVIRSVIGREQFNQQLIRILGLALICVVVGMLFGRYGALWGLPWWVYYPIPMLVNVLLPPAALSMNTSKTLTYLVLSFLSAPLIHIFFSFFLGWKEYMPFWDVPYFRAL
ncbi:MAG TPA: hypothetical protein PKM91_16255 [Cyclobacteriaceae bacterium]|jgi:hypothetical protein|nr:hypothetical protein [Cytophagales bacterium]HNP78796.1 hypothetical protein [Cyclobacteriaceae bacterium]HQQ82881.1 hypothetical protein [Cyclobacteriaceae bacterium]